MIKKSAVTAQILQTWQQLASAAQGGGSSTRSVDWPLSGNTRFHSPVRFSAPPSSNRITPWLTLLEAMAELNDYDDADTLCRRTVELYRSSTKIPRAALFLLSESGNLLRGTWGTSLAGDSVAEHEVSFQVGDSHREAFALAGTGLARWLVLPDVPLLQQTKNGPEVVASGDNLLVPILGTGRALGLFACDTATPSGYRPVHEQQLVQAAVFAAHVGGLIEKMQVRAAATESPAPLAAVRTEEALSLSYRAAAALRRDVGLSRAALAKALGVSTSVLGKAFKAHMGRSLSEYRNQVRLERFLVLVEPGGGNLLSAALDAGFGSYAQFHRVFGEKMGCSPKEFCRRLTEPKSPEQSPSAAAPHLLLGRDAGRRASALLDS